MDKLRAPAGVGAALLIAVCSEISAAFQVCLAGAGQAETAPAVARATNQVGCCPPLERMKAYLDGFHFRNGNMRDQMEAHHFVSILNDDISQAILFDGNGRDAKLIGVEYIISERLFKQLPDEEKTLWHSHAYEVKSGQLVAPMMPERDEHELMKTLASTYGKTWHTWDTSNPANQLPLGIPALMMGFTKDGQVDPEMLSKRDRALNISTDRKKANRDDIPTPQIVEGADAWQVGRTVTLEKNITR